MNINSKEFQELLDWLNSVYTEDDITPKRLSESLDDAVSLWFNEDKYDLGLLGEQEPPLKSRAFPPSISLFQKLDEIIFDAHINPDSIKHLYALPKLNRLLVLDTTDCQDYSFSVEGFKHLTKLRVNAIFDTIPSGIGELVTLEELDISLPNTSIINFSLEKLKKLWSVSLYLPLCDTLPKGIFDLPNLEELSLHTAAKIPDDISKLTKLHHLALTLSPEQGNTQFYEQLPVTRNLRALSISGEGLEPFPSWIADKNVTWLAYKGMPLGYLPEYLLDFNELYSLGLTKCGIKEIPKWVAQIPSLHSLWLSNNEIKHVPDEILEMNLGTLSLAGNPIDEKEQKRIKEIMGHRVLFE